MVSFRKGIRRKETAYPTFNNERYFDGFSRSIYITAKSHECEEVLDPEYTPFNAENDLFEAEQVFNFLFWINICRQTWAKPLSENMFILPMHIQFGRIFRTI